MVSNLDPFSNHDPNFDATLAHHALFFREKDWHRVCWLQPPLWVRAPNKVNYYFAIMTQPILTDVEQWTCCFNTCPRTYLEAVPSTTTLLMLCYCSCCRDVIDRFGFQTVESWPSPMWRFLFQYLRRIEGFQLSFLFTLQDWAILSTHIVEVVPGFDLAKVEWCEKCKSLYSSQTDIPAQWIIITMIHSAVCILFFCRRCGESS